MRRPSAAASSAPTSERTIEWQKASACTVATSTPSDWRCQSRRNSLRTVVAPSRFLQYAAKSCSPTRPVDASRSTSSSSGRDHSRVSQRRSGSTWAGLSATR